jgi:hypothetical protein
MMATYRSLLDAVAMNTCFNLRYGVVLIAVIGDEFGALRIYLIGIRSTRNARVQGAHVCRRQTNTVWVIAGSRRNKCARFQARRDKS